MTTKMNAPKSLNFSEFQHTLNGVKFLVQPYSPEKFEGPLAAYPKLLEDIHYHDFFEVFVLLENKCELFIDDKWREVNAPAVVFIPQDKPHCYRNLESCTGYFLGFPRDFIDKENILDCLFSLFYKRREYVMNFTPTEFEKIKWQLLTLCTELNQEGELFSEKATLSLFKLLLIHLRKINEDQSVIPFPT